MHIHVLCTSMQVVLDELHLMLRITDVLLRNLIYGAIQEDEKDIVIKSTEHVDKLLEAIQQCGITFRVC